MKSIQETLQCFNSYLQGGSIEKLQSYMKKYNGKRDDLDQDFYTIRINDPAIINTIQDLLKSLFIPSDQWNDYLNLDLTVFELLLALNRNSVANVQTEYLIELINKKASLRKRDFLLAGAWFTAIFAVAATIPGFSNMLVALYVLLTSASALPIVGLVYSLAITAYTLFSHQLDKKIPLYDRIRNNFFVVASMALNIASYSIWISSSIGMSPIIAGLFVGSAFVHVIKESVALINELIIKYSNKHVYADETILDLNLDYARHEFSFRKHRNAALINLATAVLLAGVMTAWNFIPGGLVLSTVAVISIGIIYGAKMLLTRKNDAMIREGLQQELQQIKKIDEKAQAENDIKQSLSVVQEGLSHLPAHESIDIVPKPIFEIVEIIEPSPHLNYNFFPMYQPVADEENQPVASHFIKAD